MSHADHTVDEGAAPERFELQAPDMDRLLAVIHAELGPAILPRETDPVVGALWLAELGKRRSLLAERLLTEADALMQAAARLLRVRGQRQARG